MFAAPAGSYGYAGQGEEWLEDWDIDVSEMDHRHVSDLHAVYPGLAVDTIETPNSPQHQSDPSTSVETTRLAEVSTGVYACGPVRAMRSVLGPCS
ncbi:glycosyl hydrolase family 95 catalytic domain-containing protein [Rhizobium leguminosarum]|uniref:glycosyl hydrolase family 95 catalytic domain-containing protein n=1 Tax=Rhizobium leguminosarum TaxID=384 RepID=UPI003F9B984C